MKTSNRTELSCVCNGRRGPCPGHTAGRLLVLAEVRLERKCLATTLALKWLAAGVGLDVSAQVRLVGKGL